MGYVVVVISVLESRALLVASSHLANLSGRTLPRGARRAARGAFTQRIIEQVPGQTHAPACLLDHVAELRDDPRRALDDAQVTVEISDDALADAARGEQRNEKCR